MHHILINLTIWEYLDSLNWSALAVIVAAIYTVLTYKLFKVSYRAMQKTNQLAEFQIYQELSKLLSTDIADKVVERCKSKTLSLTTDAEKREFKKNILDPLEDLAKFRKDSLVSIGGVYTGFSSLILYVCNCDIAVNYLNDIRKNPITSLSYGGLGDLYDELYDYCSPSEVIGLRKKLFPVIS